MKRHQIDLKAAEDSYGLLEFVTSYVLANAGIRFFNHVYKHHSRTTGRRLDDGVPVFGNLSIHRHARYYSEEAPLLIERTTRSKTNTN